MVAVVAALLATSETTTDPGVAKVERIARIAGYVIAAYFGVLFAGLAVLVLFCAVIYVVLRVNGPDSPFTRRVVARLVARAAKKSTHRADDHGDPAAVTRGLTAIRARDDLFDEQLVLEAARRALFFLYVAGVDGDDRRLRQVTTERFWTTPAGEDVATQAASRARREEAMKRMAGSPAAAAMSGILPMLLDYDAPEIELWAVEPNRDGVDHVTVRVAYRGESALAGPGASQLARARTGRISFSQLHDAPTGHSPPAMPAVDTARIGTEGWYDFDFTRSATERSGPDDGSAVRRCPACGAPYRSDLDLECRNCHVERATVDGGWKLDRSWLVVDTKAHAGEGINRDRHDAGWALRGAGKIALKIAEGALSS